MTPISLRHKIGFLFCAIFFLWIIWVIAESKGWTNGYNDAFKYMPKRQGTVYTVKIPFANPPLFYNKEMKRYSPTKDTAYRIIAHLSWDRTYSEIPNSYVKIHIEDLDRLFDHLKKVDKTIVIEEDEAKW